MAIEFEPLHPLFGARVKGLDIREPVNDDDFETILDGFHKFQILLFSAPGLSPEAHIDFSRRFGDLQEGHIQSQFLLKGHPQIFVLSNIVEDDRNIGAYNCAGGWHTDGCHYTKPSLGSLLHCVETPPEGGGTQFVSTRASYADLPDDLKKKIEGKSAAHSFLRLRHFQFPERPLSEAQKNCPDTLHPVVRYHPHTGEPALYLGTDVIAGVEGMDEDEALPLMRALLEHATQQKYVYHHSWTPGDVLLWDNRCTLHRAQPFDFENHRRRMHRTTINGQEETGIHIAHVPTKAERLGLR